MYFTEGQKLAIINPVWNSSAYQNEQQNIKVKNANFLARWVCKMMHL